MRALPAGCQVEARHAQALTRIDDVPAPDVHVVGNLERQVVRYLASVAVDEQPPDLEMHQFF